MYNHNLALESLLGISIWIIFPLVIWDIVWRGWALWEAARNNQSSWFVALLVFNTLGILPILYIYIFSPKRDRLTQDGSSN